MPRTKSKPSLVPAGGVAVADPDAEANDRAAAALLETVEAPAPSFDRTRIVESADVDVDRIDVGSNVREDLGELDDLVESIRSRGIVSPVTLAPAGDRFELLYGQRRLAAARLAGLPTIPALVVSTPVDGVSRVADQLVENLHRRDLNPIERARGIQSLVDSGMSQVDVGKLIGRAESTISNDLRLLELTPKVQAAISTGAISASHGKTIVSLPAKQQNEVAAKAVDRGLSSHDLEREIGYAGDAAKQDAKRAKNTTRSVSTLAEKLKAAGVPSGTRIGISGHAMDVDVKAVEKAATDAGFEIDENLRYVSTYYGIPEGCTCTTYLVSVGGRTKVEKVCNVAAHREKGNKTKQAAEERERQDRQKRIKAIATHVNNLLQPAAAAYHAALAAIPRPALEIVALARQGYVYDVKPTVAKINKATPEELAVMAGRVEGLNPDGSGHVGSGTVFSIIDLTAALAELGLDDPVKAIALPAPDDVEARASKTRAKQSRKAKASPSTIDATVAEAPSDTETQETADAGAAAPSSPAPEPVDDEAPAAPVE